MGDLLKARDVARLLGVSERTVVTHAGVGGIPGFRVGGVRGPWRFHAGAIAEHMGLEPGERGRERLLEMLRDDQLSPILR